MFGVGYRTPAKGSQTSRESDSGIPKAPEKNEMGASTLEPLVEADNLNLTKVRRSIGEWEMGKAGSAPLIPSPPVKEADTAPIKQKTKTTLSQGGPARGTSMTLMSGSVEQEALKPRGRVAEAKACLVKAKLQINSSRNLKAEIRTDVIQAIEKLYRLVKEAEANKPLPPSSTENNGAKIKETRAWQSDEVKELESNLARKIEEHGQMLKENTEQIKKLNLKLEESRPVTYASVAAAPASQPVHSMIVSSTDTDDTSEDVIAKIRTAVNARTSGIRVDRLRKAREGKVVLGCQSRDELAKITEKLKSEQPALQIEHKENKDPLVILKNVLNFNTDDDIAAALQRQNAHILGVIPEQDYRAVVRYRRKARNPHECHVVLRVSPQVWKCLTSAGRVHIDLQRVQVVDQSPLLQCTKCLAYGHGKKSCAEAADLCSHCTGPHMRKDCPYWTAGEAPKCRNCTLAKQERTDHNAFDAECPCRKKWDRLARSNVAYC